MFHIPPPLEIRDMSNGVYALFASHYWPHAVYSLVPRPLPMQNVRTFLWVACEKGNAAVVELLLQAGADTNTDVRGHAFVAPFF
jgi:ankyrin repeat protein